MSKIRAVRTAYNEGGIRLVVNRARCWLAGQNRQQQVVTPPAAKAPKAGRSIPGTVDRTATANDVDYVNAIAWFELRRPRYEKLASSVAAYVEPDGVFFDVGSNLGYFTKLLAEQTDFRGTAHLFEPIPHLTRLSNQFLQDAPYRVNIHEYGLSDADGVVDIFYGVRNLGWNTMVADKAHSNMIPLQVQVKDFNGTGIKDVPSFIKIDVEGAEHLVIAGLIDSLASWSKKPVILCEIGWGVSHPQWAEELAAFASLEAIGYRTVDLDGDPVDVTTLTETSDVVFLPATPSVEADGG